MKAKFEEVCCAMCTREKSGLLKSTNSIVSSFDGSSDSDYDFASILSTDAIVAIQASGILLVATQLCSDMDAVYRSPQNNMRG